MHSGKGAKAGGAQLGPLQPFHYQPNRLQILDQTRLPGSIHHLLLKDAQAVIRAIQRMAVRGAPLIGVVAAYGLAVEAENWKGRPRLRRHLKSTAQSLKSARPTAINLSWAIARLESILEDPKVEEKNLPELIRLEAKKIEAEEAQSCAEVGRWGARLIKDGDRILTYCNTGRLATPGMGTALGVIYQANKLGRRFEVIVCETRPLLQGARLTTFELLESGIPTCLITDNALARVMPTIDKVIVGADRIALDGSVANKIGTYMLAIMAHYFKIPFYVAAPLSTIDPNSSLGAEIPIEYRDAQEVTHLAGRRIAPQGIRVMNPAFDVTPPELLSGIITEKGIITPPFKDRIKELAQEP